MNAVSVDIKTQAKQLKNNNLWSADLNKQTISFEASAVRMRIRTQLMVGFGFLLILMISIAIVATWRVNIINSTLTAIVDINAVKQRQAINFRGSVHDRAIAFRDLALLENGPEQEKTLEAINRLANQYKVAAQTLDDIFAKDDQSSNEEKLLLNTIKDIELRTVPLLDTFLQYNHAGEREKTKDLLIHDIRPAFAEWLVAINRFIDWQEQKSQKETVTTRQTAEGFPGIMAIFCIIGVLFGSGIAYLITRYLLRSLGGEPSDVAAVVHRIASGDLQVEIHTNYEASILSAIANMQVKLREMVMRIATASADIASQTEHLGESSRNVLQSAKEQALLATASAASLEEMTQSVKEVSLITQQTESNSEKASDLSVEGVVLIQSVTNEIAVVARTVKISSEQVSSLQRRSEEISGIVGAIRAIADQTNLLALNAAIEAARAGENGRGFAVVADEVRQLALRTTEATSEISRMIVHIQNETRETVTAMQAIEPLVARSQAISNQAAEQLTQIRNQSNDSLNNVRDIVRVTEQQVLAIADIAHHVEQISAMSLQTSEVTQGNAQSTETLDRTTKILEQEVQRFRFS